MKQMSSACVCHMEEFCFYCEIHVPFEKKYKSLEAENAALKQEKERIKDVAKRACELKDKIIKNLTQQIIESGGTTHD